jgi:hypothetical protein
VSRTGQKARKWEEMEERRWKTTRRKESEGPPVRRGTTDS